MHYHLTKETRIKFSALLMTGISLRQAARLLGVNHTTLSRELRSNIPVSSKVKYHPGDAHRQAKERRRKANQRFRKIEINSYLDKLIVACISVKKWAPEQISGWLKSNHKPVCVCTQTIYDWIYLVRRELIPYLHCLKVKYRLTRQASLRKKKRAEIHAKRHISQRPSRIESRKTYGHWEGDTVHGMGKSGYIATLVERKSGYLIARVILRNSCNSLSFADAVISGVSPMPQKLRQTITLDNGPEMKLPERIERNTGMKVYYATPYHSWERGTNENTNGLLRYFFPKKSSFKNLTQKELDLAVKLLNTRPRKRLNWRTPEQMLKRSGGAV